MKYAVLGFLASIMVALCDAPLAQVVETLNYQVDVTGSESIWKGPYPLPPPGLSGPNNVSNLSFAGVLTAQIILDNTASGMVAIETTTITGSATGIPLVLADTLFPYEASLTFVQGAGGGSLTFNPGFTSATVAMGDHTYRDSGWDVIINSAGASADYRFDSSGGCLNGSYTPGSCTLNVASTSAATWTMIKAPEINPATSAGGLTLLLGSLAVLRGRKRVPPRTVFPD